MTSKVSLERILEEFILGRKGKIALDELLLAVQAKAGKNVGEKEILDVLETRALAFSRDLESFMPRHVFFRNAKFMISPTEEEAKERILFPGHRFVPFCSLGVRPWNCTLKTDGVLVPRAEATRKLKALAVYHSLFGTESLPGILIADHPANEEPLLTASGPSTEAVLTVYDFSVPFEKWGFKFGDGLLFTVEDWSEGIYSVDHVPAKERKSLMKKSKDWIERMEKGFLKAFDDLGLDYPMEEQIAYGYYYAGKEALKQPPIHLGGFIDSSSKVNFVEYGMETRLWNETHLDPALLRLPETLEAEGATGSIDAIFRDLGISLSEVELEAYMRDELFHRREEPEEVLKRVFSGRPLQFYSDEQLDDFVKYFDKLWKRVQRSYNFFADQHAGKVREKILVLLDRHIEWLRSLDSRGISAEALPVKEMTLAAQTSAFLETYLRIFNKKNPVSEAEIDEVLDLLPQIDSSLEGLRRSIEESLKGREGAAPARNLKLVKAEAGERKGRGKQARQAFVLKIALQHLKPPVWRRLKLAGDFTLAELHEALQVAMGWDNYHAHSFLIDSRFYAPADEEGRTSDDEIDEAQVTLEELGFSEGAKFRYTYDFGDDWVHLVSVEEVVSEEPSPEKDSPRVQCLAGKRACPPEDCGGAAGYEEILEALKAPHKKKYRERLDWLGDYDPEAFDLEAVNARLQGLGF